MADLHLDRYSSFFVIPSVRSNHGNRYTPLTARVQLYAPGRERPFSAKTSTSPPAVAVDGFIVDNGGA